MRFWLVKSEPETYSIADFAREGTTSWTGVRNYAARNHLRAMKKNDRVFFYESGSEPGIVGEGRVTSLPYPETPVWTTIDLSFVRAFPEKIPREKILATEVFQNSILKRQGRLSVQPLTAGEVTAIRTLARAK